MSTTETIDEGTFRPPTAQPPPAVSGPAASFEAPRGWSLGLWVLNLGAAMLLLLAGIPAYRSLQEGGSAGSLALGLAAFMGAWWFLIFSAEIAAAIHIRRGVRLDRAGDSTGALDQFRLASRLGGRLWGLPDYNLGSALHRAGELHEAVARYRSAMRRGRGLLLAGAPRVSEEQLAAIRANLTLALQQLASQGRTAPAEADLPLPPAGFRAAALGPLWVLFLSGLALMGAIPGLPAVTLWTRGMGYALLVAGISLALAACAKARAHVQQAKQLAAAGATEQALAELRTAMRLHDLGAEGHLELGQVLETAGDLPAARRAYRDALRLEPGSQCARARLTSLLPRMGEPAARPEHRQAAAPLCGPRAPERGSLWFSMGLLAGATCLFTAVMGPEFAARLLSGQSQTVVQALFCTAAWITLALWLLKCGRELRLHRFALALQQAGDLDGAVEVYDEALGNLFSPRRSVTTFNRATALQSKGDAAGAVRDYRAVLCSPEVSQGVSLDAAHNLREWFRSGVTAAAPMPPIASLALWRLLWLVAGASLGFFVAASLPGQLVGAVIGAAVAHAVGRSLLPDPALRGALALIRVGDLEGGRGALAVADARGLESGEAHEALKRLETSGPSIAAGRAEAELAPLLRYPAERGALLAFSAAAEAVIALILFAALCKTGHPGSSAHAGVVLSLGFLLWSTAACFHVLEAQGAREVLVGQSLELAGDTKGALAAYQRASMRTAGSDVALAAQQLSGRLLLGAGKPSDAVSCFRHAVRSIWAVDLAAPALHDLSVALDAARARMPEVPSRQIASLEVTSPAAAGSMAARLPAGYLAAICVVAGYLLLDLFRLFQAGWANSLAGAMLGALAGLAAARRFHARVHLERSAAFLRAGDAQASIEEVAHASRAWPCSTARHAAIAAAYESLGERAAARHERGLAMESDGG